jgi:hypothetical protein
VRHAQDVTSYIVVRTTALLGETHADSLTALHLCVATAPFWTYH